MAGALARGSVHTARSPRTVPGSGILIGIRHPGASARSHSGPLTAAASRPFHHSADTGMRCDSEAAPSSIELVAPQWPAPARVRAFCTTRPGGVSRPPFTHLNLSFGIGDDPAAVAENRALLAARLGLPEEPLWMRQVHGARVLEAGVAEPDSVGDACVARSPASPCVVAAADCLPVLLCAGNGSVVAAAHAGWRGLAAGVVENTVAEMKIPPSEIIAWLGPAIGASAYEVGPEVRDAFVDRNCNDAIAFSPSLADRWKADLAGLARARLRRCGVGAVYGGKLCTHSNPRRFYSYRRDGRTGRLAALIWIEPPAPHRQHGIRPA